MSRRFSPGVGEHERGEPAVEVRAEPALVGRELLLAVADEQRRPRRRGSESG